MTNYDLQPTDELLELLEVAGRTPDPDLIRACLARGSEITPSLLSWLEAEGEEGWDEQESWDDDDPRWYRSVHAALILIGLRDPAALPVFRRIMAKDEGYLLEWINEELPAYGPLATDWAIEILHDPSLPMFSRAVAAELLRTIGRDHPDELVRILPGLRETLPALDATGSIMLPDEEVLEDEVEVWSWAALSLGQLHDAVSRPVITKLYEADLIDEFVLGDLEDYQKMLRDDARATKHPKQSYDVLATYESLRQRGIAEQAKHTESAPPVRIETPSYPAAFPQADTTPYVRATPKIGRNDPCPCGSGRKYKHCHGKK